MFALVLFSDGIYYICKKSDVKTGKSDASIKYKDGKRYVGKIIAWKESYEQLNQLKTELELEENEEEEELENEEEELKENEEKIGNASSNKYEAKLLNSGKETTLPRATEIDDFQETSYSEKQLTNTIQPQKSLNNISNPNHEIINSVKERVETLDSNTVGNSNESALCDNEPWSWSDYNLEVFSPQPDTMEKCTNYVVINYNEYVNDSVAGQSQVNEYSEFSIRQEAQDENSNVLLLNSANEKNKKSSTRVLESEMVKSKNGIGENSLDNVSNTEVPVTPSIHELKTVRDSEHNNSCVDSPDDSSESYVPDSDFSDDSKEESETSFPRTSQTSQKTPDKSTNMNRTRSSCGSTFDLDVSLSTCMEGHSAPNNEDMFVKTIESGNKKDFCIYCHTEQAKLSRHLARKHREIKDVESFLDLPKGHDERKKIIAKIRKQGQFFFNTNKDINNGELKVIRRPKASFTRNAVDYATCKVCMGTYAKTTLWRHYNRCSKKKSLKTRTLLSGARRIEGRIHSVAQKVLRRRVFPTLIDDRVTRVIRYDELIIMYGNKLCNKYKNPRHFDMIRQKLRQLGRFLLEVKKLNADIDDLTSVLCPQNYDLSIAAIQSLAGLNESGNGFKVPSLATSMGTALKQVAKLCISLWIRRQQKEKQTLTEDFYKLLCEDYSSTIARTAIESQFSKKRQSKVVLPSKSDVEKLQLYLRNKVDTARNLLEEEFSHRAWFDLAEGCLISIQLFNRRRAGEIERTLIEDFNNFETISEKTVGKDFESFTNAEKKAANKYVRFTIRGKLGRTVPVLLHKHILESLKLVLKFRKFAKVDPKNPYLFGISGTFKGDYRYLRACELMRKFSTDCEADNPETLRGTILRKHIATMCTNFNLKDDEVTDLANFMGHAEKIHRTHYRQPILSREIFNVSKLLELVQGKDDEISDEDAIEETINQESLVEDSSEVTSTVGQSFVSQTQSTHTSIENISLPPYSVNSKSNEKRKRSTSPFGKCNRVRWADEEKKLVLESFKSHILARTLPSLEDIQKLKNANPGVLNRNSATIKTWIHNLYKSKAND